MLSLNNISYKINDQYKGRCNTTISYGITRVVVSNPPLEDKIEQESDLIYFFKMDGKNILLTERLPRNRYGLLKWIALYIKYAVAKQEVKFEGFIRNITLSWNCIDITFYDPNWLEFFKGGRSNVNCI